MPDPNPASDWNFAIPCHRYSRHLAAAHVVYVNNVYQGATPVAVVLDGDRGRASGASRAVGVASPVGEEDSHLATAAVLGSPAAAVRVGGRGVAGFVQGENVLKCRGF